MQRTELESVPELDHVPVLQTTHPAVVELMTSEHFNNVAEASDMHQLFDLVHRSEYQPLIAVQHEDETEGESVSVLFARLDDPFWKPLSQLNLVVSGQDQSSVDRASTAPIDADQQTDGMENHNASIYHCISCGRVEHVELDAKPPHCCGRTMVKASEETIHEGSTVDETAKDNVVGPSDPEFTEIKDNKRSR